MSILRTLLIFLSVALVGCASGGGTLQNQINNETIWNGMPEPITQRYPMVEYQAIETPRQVVMADEDYFSCNAEEASTLTDDLPLLDVSFIETDILDALLELSFISNLSIISDDSIEGLVSVNLANKTLEEALTAIISPGNYAYKVYDSFIYVGSQSPVSPSFHLLSTSCLYKPVFTHPDQLVEMLTPYYQQYVNYIEGHDYLSIVAPDSIQKRIQQDIRIFDKAPQQVLLEVSIVEVSAEALEILGVKWNREIETGQLLRQNNVAGSSVFSFYDQRTSASPVAQALIDSVSAINAQEDLQIRAMPSMVTLNGRQANFSSIQTSWLDLDASNLSNNRREGVEYGVNLSIVPFISLDKQIRLEIIDASVSDLTQDLDDEYRLISHAISTSVLMIDGETLVLGGLLQKKQRNQNSNVPGASSLPFMGGLFKQKDNELVDTEVLIVIRPKIMEG